MNRTNHLLETLIWTKTKDAQKRMPRNKPKPFVPSFMPQPSTEINEGSVAHSTEDIRKILAKPRV